MTKWPSMPALAPAVNESTWTVTFGQVAVSASAVQLLAGHGGAADLAVQHRLVQDHVDLRRLRPAG